ncbi:MobA-like NTP transferase domain-containing protein [Halorientalis persicus]|uniref:MobA-like NTP transferase domain-containing protein n=1 Tax=Halorientalis persicus TaxID=1367881 RepID=A0A1H8VFC6_9EURY|nr:NTP transferase domain-containing protein [Halorientalis persicus]SEP14162.1 MobA-like NTP transferase domain-containing protein [Halorientalis persicus]
MRVLTLAAGLGSRLVPSLEKPIPKALISLGSENLLERQVRQLSNSEETLHTAVIGRQGECWTEDYIRQFQETVDKTIVNERNAETEAGYSFLLGLESIPEGEDVLVIDGDIVAEDELLLGFRDHGAENVALVRAVETKVGFDRGACVSFTSKGERIERCGFDVQSNYVYSGAMRLSSSCVKSLSKLKPEEYEQEQLATLIDEIAQESELTGYTVNPQARTIPTVDEPLDGYSGTGETTLEKRKNRITKRAHSESKKLRDEIDRLRHGHSRFPNHFPEILEVSLFDEEPSYEMPDYTERGYQPLDEILRSGTAPDVLVDLAEDPLRFISEEFGEEADPIPGLYKNTFLPKIQTRYSGIKEATPRFESVAEAERISVDGERIPGLAKVKQVLESDTEFLGRLEPTYMTDFHGDFKPDNILVDKKSGDFLLIDPRGRSEIGTTTHDPIYDLAKFLTSTYGYYTAFKHGDFELSVEVGPAVAVKYEIVGKNRGYEKLTEAVLTQVERINGDDDWKVRVDALTGLLLIANAPVHIDGDQDQMAVVELVRGLELFEQARTKFKSRTNDTGDVININTGTDLDHAQSIFD